MAKTVAEQESHLRRQPVEYNANGTVKFPVTYSQLLKECKRLWRVSAAKSVRIKEAEKSLRVIRAWAIIYDYPEVIRTCDTIFNPEKEKP